jgi:hypothetical protein
MEISLLGLDRRNRDLAPCQTALELHKFLWREVTPSRRQSHSFETMQGVCEGLFVFLVNMLDL